MSITRAGLSQSGNDLNDLATATASYEAAVREQVTAIVTNVDAIGASWSGPLPEELMGRAHHWVGEIYEAANTIRDVNPILRSWAQSAWAYSDRLPDARDHNDPDAAAERQQVAGYWRMTCESNSALLAAALRQLERYTEAEMGGPLHGMFEMFEGVGDFFGGGFSALGGLFASFAASADPIGWGEWMRGQQPHQEDMDLALLSNDVYDGEGWNDPHRTIGNGWTRVPADDLPAGLSMADFENAEFGNDMRAALYTDGSGHYVLAFAGTDSFSDAFTNVFQGVGLDTQQYDHARRLGQRLSVEYGDNLVMTGHSLGGGAASYAALSTGSAAVTFNAAGLSDDSIERAGLDWKGGREQAAEGQIRAYRVQSDILTNTQEEFDDIPDAVGAPITIANPIDQPSDWWLLTGPFGAGMQGGHAVDMHLMGNVLAGMQASDVTFSTTYSVDHGGGDVTTEHSAQIYEGGWFNR